MKRIIDRMKYWGQVFLLPVYWLSFLVPRDKKIWVVGSTFGRRWADNARYFYLYLDQYERDKIRPIWITRKKEIVDLLAANGKEVYYVHSLKGIFYCLKAKVYVFDNYSKDICFWLSGGAKKINLWHGAGNKKTNHDNQFDYLRHPRNWRERFSTALTRMSNEKPSHYILASSPVYKELFISAFQVPRSHIILEGYPRNVVLQTDKITNILSDAEKHNLSFIQQKKQLGYRLLVYMPTFRSSEMKFFSVVNLQKFNVFLEENKIILLTKMHPKSRAKEEFERVSFSNVVNVDADVDPYTFLREIDMLITDYSSIYSDFSLMGKPTVIFPFDYEEYASDTREDYVPFDEYIKCEKAYNQVDLERQIIEKLDKDPDQKARKWLIERTFSCQDENTSERLFLKIADIIKLPLQK